MRKWPAMRYVSLLCDYLQIISLEYTFQCLCSIQPNMICPNTGKPPNVFIDVGMKKTHQQPIKRIPKKRKVFTRNRDKKDAIFFQNSLYLL